MDKILLARKTFDSLNAMTLTSFCEEDDKKLLQDIVFIKFQQKVANTTPISMQVKIFDIRLLASIIVQVIKVVKNINEDNIKLKRENKEPKKIAFTSSDTIITNKSGSISDQKTISVGFQKNTLYINGLHDKNKISLGFKKVEIEPLIDSLKLFAEYSEKEYYGVQAELDKKKFNQ